jgi:hypothetical protein
MAAAAPTTPIAIMNQAQFQTMVATIRGRSGTPRRMNLYGYTYHIYKIDTTASGFFGDHAIIIIEDERTNTILGYFTLMSIKPWIELFDFQKNPEPALKTFNLMPILCNYLDFIQGQLPDYHIWAGSYVDKLIEKYVQYGFRILFARNSSTVSPLGTIAGPGQYFTSLIYKLHKPSSFYRTIEMDSSIYTHPIRFAFTFDGAAAFITHLLSTNILAKDQPEKGFVFYQLSTDAPTLPTLQWHGSHFQCASGLLNYEVKGVSERFTPNALAREIIGLVPIAEKAHIHIIGHTHPKSMYTAYSAITQNLFLIGPPSGGDIKVSILPGCPLQCIFSIEGMYVVERIRKPTSDSEINAYMRLCDQYDEYIMNHVHSNLTKQMLTFRTVEEIQREFNNMRRAAIRQIITLTNSVFRGLLHMRFHVYNYNHTSQIAYGILPEHITIASLENPKETLLYNKKGSTKIFHEISPDVIKKWTMTIPETQLQTTRSMFEAANVMVPLDYFESPKTANDLHVIRFRNGFGNRSATNWIHNMMNANMATSMQGHAMMIEEPEAMAAIPSGYGHAMMLEEPKAAGGAGHAGGRRKRTRRNKPLKRRHRLSRKF